MLQIIVCKGIVHKKDVCTKEGEGRCGQMRTQGEGTEAMRTSAKKTTVTCGNNYFLIIRCLIISLLFDLILPLGSVNNKWRYLVFSLGLAMSPCHIKLPGDTSVPISSISSYTVQ